jgi:hypothetical protein
MKLLNARKKLVTLAVASAVAGGAMLSAPAQAMNVSQNNKGEVLLFPYYTVKNGLDTIFSVTNTSNKTSLIKIRFREALNSREVRDFNVALSPHDVWNGIITTSGSGAAIRTYDNSCTSPNKSAWNAVAGTTGYEVPFSNLRYTGTTWADGGPTDLGRTKEGYFEVFLMGQSIDENDDIAGWAKHATSGATAGVPNNCAAIDSAFASSGTAFTTAFQNYTLAAGDNVLKGHETMINVGNGTAYDAEPTAIEDFMTGSDNIVYAPTDNHPDLTDGDAGATAAILNNGVVQNVSANSGTSQDNVSALLMATDVINEFVTGGASTVTSTSWVLTFPTKHYYADPKDASCVATGPANAPFTTCFGVIGGVAKAPDPVSDTYWNREEASTTTPPSGTNFSPYDPASPTGASLPHEVNVVDFNGSALCGTGANHLGIDTSDVANAAAGWMDMSLVNATTGLQSAGGTLTGLPVIGFAAVLRDTAVGASANYSGVEQHSYTRTLLAPPAPILK